jgi:small-conductance mechanosensitive channel
MSEKSQALRLINDLLSDFRDPDFVWQVVALIVCLALAGLIASWWRGRHAEGAGRISDASSRLAFPLTGMVLTGLALSVLGSVIHVNLLKLAMPLLGSMALVRGVVFVLRQAFPQATWLTAWERIIAATVWGWLALYITDLAPYVIDAMESVQFHVGKQHIDLWTVLRGIATIFLTVVFALWIAGVIEARLMRVQSLDANLRLVGVRVAKAVLTVVAILASLALVGIDMTALSVFTGALGVGLGFGLQKIASNYVSGFIILLDRSIRIGDLVTVDNRQGVVKAIESRYTVIRSLDGTESIIPNETMITQCVTNHSFTDRKVAVKVKVTVGYATDVDRAFVLLLAAAGRQPRILADPAPGVFISALGDNGIDIEMSAWIADPDQGQMQLRGAILKEVLEAFRAEGIEIPFPQRDVRVVG